MKDTSVVERYKVGDRRTVVVRFKKGTRKRVGDEWITFTTNVIVPMTQEVDDYGHWGDRVLFVDKAIAAPSRLARILAWVRYKVLRMSPIPRATIVSEKTAEEVPMKKD